jgi:hypothetical protein
MAVGPTYPLGLMPATRSRILVAGTPSPRAVAISAIDKPFISIISEIYQRNIKKSIKIVKFFQKGIDKIYQ